MQLLYTLPSFCDAWPALDPILPFISFIRCSDSIICHSLCHEEKSLGLGCTTPSREWKIRNKSLPCIQISSSFFCVLLFTWHLRMQNGVERRQKWTAANIRMKIRRNLFKMRRSFFIHWCYKWRSGFADLICWCRCMMQLRQTLCIACFKCGKECARRSINCSFSKKRESIYCMYLFWMRNVK